MARPTLSLVLLALTAGSTVVMPTSASAQDNRDAPESGFYVGAKIGVTSPSDETFDGVQAPEGASPGTADAPAAVRAEFDEDVTFAGTVGYRLGTRFLGVFEPSIEVEYSYASSDISGGNFNGGDQTFGGDVDVNTFTIGYRSDIRWSDNQRIVPFAGGAIGVADVDSNIAYFPNNGVATAPTFALTGSDTGFVTQSNLGLSFQLTDNIDLETSVRYQRVSGLDFERRFVDGGNNDFNSDLSGSLETVSGFAGLRYRF